MRFYVDIYLDHNLGDDLFLDTLLQRYPDHEFYVGVPDNIERLNGNFKKYKNLKIIKTLSIKFIFNIIKFDAYITIGGSIYMDLDRSFHRIWLSRLIKSFFCVLTGRPFFVIGANLGPFNTLVGKCLLFIHFNLVKHISVRDVHSYRILQKWKKLYNYSIAPDVVFSHKSQFNNKNSNEVLGVSVINTRRHPEVKELYVKKMQLLISRYLDLSLSNKVIIMGFDGGIENDDEIVQELIVDEKIKQMLLSGRVEVVNYSLEIDMMFFLSKFNQCSGIVCSRFHAMILAMKYNINYYPICYSEKMENVLTDMRSNVTGVKYKNINELDVDGVLDILRSADTLKFDRFKMQFAEGHFYCIDKLILGNSI